ncbi:MAG: putative toxin-antitoxin system toxin component, PIN family [Thermoflexales bacterium]
MRLLLGTNVLVAAIAADGLCRDLVRRRVLGHTLITSEYLLAEFLEVMARTFELTAEDIPLFAAYRDRAEIVSPAPLAARVCADPDDDNVLAAAIAGGADGIITGGADLLILGAYAGVSILTPRGFVERMDRPHSGDPIG